MLDLRSMPCYSCFMLDECHDFLVIQSAINQGSGLPTQCEFEDRCDRESRATGGRRAQGLTADCNSIDCSLWCATLRGRYFSTPLGNWFTSDYPSTILFGQKDQPYRKAKITRHWVLEGIFTFKVVPLTRRKGFDTQQGLSDQFCHCRKVGASKCRAP